jgi:hypothetical protein
MKPIIALTILFFTLTSHAQGPQLAANVSLVPPDIQCELRVSTVGKDGTPALGFLSREFIVTATGGEATLEGFKVQAKLSRTCAADGGPCSPTYFLQVQTLFGKTSSTSGESVLGYDPKKPKSAIRGWSYYRSRMQVDTDDATVECMILDQ